ncbi:ubiquinol oxidase subunit II [Roseiarcaceae bacterium H3SJ34-1]|uniref:ubiquinol oxidase subunit II n=1 Tax=Terripilifer ovatus TaxID=3032367 RepID=UPI003AB961C8|nr:ubiquinol oxidase subunit II [Roseiarcaceae bacterium H3SJ34-1]
MPARPARIVAGALALSLAGCGGVLDPQGPVGAAEKLILFNALAIMLVIVVPTIAATLAFAWWFRASNSRALYRPYWAFSGTLELIVWAIPALVVIFLGGIAWFGSHALDPYRPLPGKAQPVEIEVVSLDWKWLFIYPQDGMAAVNQLVIPVGKAVHFRLTSSGVMNSFFVPQLGSQIYTMAGMTSQLSLQADRAGTYNGLSAQFSGEGFSGMRFEVRAVASDDYAAWIAGTKAAGPRLDQAAYADLAKPSKNVAPGTYREVEAGLFDSIVSASFSGLEHGVARSMERKP